MTTTWTRRHPINIPVKFIGGASALFLSACALSDGRDSEPAPSTTNKAAAVEARIDYRDMTSGGYQGIRTYLDNNVGRIKSGCHARNAIIQIDDIRVLCVTGALNEERQAGLDREEFDYAYVWSGGGAADTAIRLGKAISRNEAPLIVESYCLSSCANYLVPAAYGLYMLDGSVIAIHGTMPRGRQAYIMSQLRHESRGMDQASRDHFVEGESFGDKVLRYFREYPEFAEKNVMMEMSYFKDIGIDDGFVTRYNEVVRRLKTRGDYICEPDGIVNLVVGPKHLQEFSINIVRQWFPESRKFYLEKLYTAAEEGVIIFDYDDHPFSLKKKKFVSEAYCKSDVD